MIARRNISSNVTLAPTTTMEPMCLLFNLFVIVGHTVPTTEAGLLGPIKNIFKSNSNNAENGPDLFNQMPSPFRDNNQPLENNDFDPNNQRLPIGHPINSRTLFENMDNLGLPLDGAENLRFPLVGAGNFGLPLDGIGNSRLPFNGATATASSSSSNSILHLNDLSPSSLYTVNPPNGQPGKKPKPGDTTTTTQSNNKKLKITKPTTKSTSSTPDYDKYLAQRFPGAFKLLDELKKLNELKAKKNETTTTTTTLSTPRSYEKDDIDELLQPEDVGVKEHPEPKEKKKKVLKKITKKKFYYKATAVRPAVEKKNRHNQTVYYVDIINH